MIPTSSTLPGRDGTPVATYRWEPAGPVRGVVQIVHGLGEHVRRYDHLATTLTAAGFLVQGHDTRGHGATIADGAEPGVIGAEGWRAAIDDIGVLLDRLRTDAPGVPVVLLGHSMGSFAVQQYLVDHSERVDAVVRGQVTGNAGRPSSSGATTSLTMCSICSRGRATARAQ